MPVIEIAGLDRAPCGQSNLAQQVLVGGGGWVGKVWARGCVCQNRFRTILGGFGLVYFSGNWDVHWGYGLLTHGHVSKSRDKIVAMI